MLLGCLLIGRLLFQWSVNMTSELYNVSGNHVLEGDAYKEDMDVDISKVSMRAAFATPLNLDSSCDLVQKKGNNRISLTLG